MESKEDMPLFHMESSGIHMEWCWNPYGINHSMTIPSSFHMESSGIHMEWCWNPYGINHSMTIPSSFHMESMMYME
jgi:hypothetical protein